jgi:hypothetical protein
VGPVVARQEPLALAAQAVMALTVPAGVAAEPVLSPEPAAGAVTAL